MVASHVLAGSIVALSAMAQVVRAQSVSYPGNLLDNINTNFTFTDCAAPADMQSCWNAQNITEDQDTGPQCAGLENRITCALTNCWNRVYSCDYQQLALEYNQTCFYRHVSDGDQLLGLNVPFTPPPDNAAGECSCNLVEYLDTIRRIGEEDTTCEELNDPNESEDDDGNAVSQYSSQCDCCVYGGMNAALQSICPNTDPTLLQRDSFVEPLSAHNTTISECPSLLSNFSCPNNGWGSDGVNASAWAIASLPSPTGLLTDVTGAVITTPVSGATYTWTGINSTYTVTAASTAAVATRTAASVSGSTSGTSSASATSSAGAATMLGNEKNCVVAFAAFAGFAFAVLQ